MSDLGTLSAQIELRLAEAKRRHDEQRRHDEEECQRMRDRHSRYDEVSSGLVQEIILPRMNKLASYFSNATVQVPAPLTSAACRCRFQHSPRFPATVVLSIGCTHDDSVENVVLSYDLEILPVFLKFEPHDQFVCPLDRVDVDRIAAWLDAKVVTFVETYLRIESLDQYQEHSRVTDPVCGTRFNRDSAVASTEYQGHCYYFVAQQNQRTFDLEPQRYVKGTGTHA